MGWPLIIYRRGVASEREREDGLEAGPEQQASIVLKLPSSGCGWNSAPGLAPTETVGVTVYNEIHSLQLGNLNS